MKPTEGTVMILPNGCAASRLVYAGGLLTPSRSHERASPNERETIFPRNGGLEQGKRRNFLMRAGVS